MRGTWFYEQSWDPLEEDLCERIELEHMNKFKEHILNKPNNETSSISSENDALLLNQNNENLNSENNPTEAVSSNTNNKSQQSKAIIDRM